MFLILEFAACFIAVCVLALLALAVFGTGYVLTIVSRKPAKALHLAYFTRALAQEAAASDNSLLPSRLASLSAVSPL